MGTGDGTVAIHLAPCSQPHPDSDIHRHIVEKHPDDITVTVADTGIGIPYGEQERVFERFYRVSRSRSKDVDGTGLGLSIVKHGAMLHNATISMDSEPGKGRSVDKDTYYALQAELKDNFYGNVEANEVLNSPSEIIITDGFTGNVCMKTLEGTAKAMGKMLKEEIKSSLGGIIGYLFMKKNLKRFQKRMDSSEIGGAMILGVGVPVIKAHGNSEPYAFYNAIRQAYNMVKEEVIKHIIEASKEELNEEH